MGASGKEPAYQMEEHGETQVLVLGLLDSLKEGMMIHSNILAWKIPMDEALQATVPWSQVELDLSGLAEQSMPSEVFTLLIPNQKEIQGQRVQQSPRTS